MAQQSYKKFVASAATATLVASALIPVASAASVTTSAFTDVPASYKEAVDFVVKNNIASGISETKFGIDQQIKRGDVAIMIAAAAGLNDEKAPASGFSDVPKRGALAVNSLKAAGVISGKSDTKFGFEDNIKRGEAALMLQKAFDLKAGDTKNSFTDVSDRYDAAVDALVANKVTSGINDKQFGTDNLIKRGDFAKFLFALKDKIEAPGEATIESVKATNAKTIEVKFGKAVDTEKAKIELLRGTFKQNVTLVWADDKKSVQLVGANNFQAADYTVNVTGLGEKTLTGSVKIEAQKVSSIEILSDVAVLSANPNGLITTETATVGYVVKDQYGTDITKTTQVTTNNTNVEVDGKGKITLKGLNNMKIGDLVPVVLVHASSGTTTSATVKLSAAATVADIQVDGLYNAKGEKVELNDATKANSAFLVVNLKDQYGNAITPANATDTAAGIIVTNTNPLVAKLVNDKVTTTKIAGKDKFVVQFEKLNADNEFKAGAAELLFITTMNGNKFMHTVNVAETKTTDSVTVGQPEHAILGEAVQLPITVMDKDGNVITDKDLLTHPTKGIKINGKQLDAADKSKLTVKDGQVYYNNGVATGSADSYVTATVSTSTYKIETVTYKVTAKAKPVSVRGLKTPLVIKAGKSAAPIDFTKVNIEDQYGRTMTQERWDAAGSNYSVEVKAVDTANEYISVDTTSKVVTAKNKNGASNIVLYLKDSSITDSNNTLKEVPNSAVEQQVRVTDGTEYSAYEIAPIGKVQASDVESAGAKKFTVNGLLNGGKVELTPGATSEYTAEVVGLPGAVTNNEITIAKAAITTDGKIADKEFTLRVTINATGKVIEQKFVVSANAKKVEDFFFTAATASSDYADADAITEAIVKGGTYSVASQIVKDDASTTALNVATVDQYGNKTVSGVSGTLTIVPDKASDVTITNNGTANAEAVLKDGIEETKLTVKVKIGNATKELKVTLKAS